MGLYDKKICVVGLGYIGLPTAALLANRGYNVNGVDIVQEVVDVINQGQIHIVEPELDTFVRATVGSKRLIASTKPKPSDIYIIAVPTPFYPTQNQGDIPKPNLEYVFAAAHSIAPLLKHGDVIILESTSPVGTTQQIEKLVREQIGTQLLIHIAYCPERVLPGHIMRELVENDRIVGGTTPESTKIVSDFYAGFVTGAVLQTTANTAEMAKLTENSFRDVNIAFANELSILCQQFNIDVSELIALANRHPRVNILSPGCGVGGHCIAVDPWFLVSAAPEHARLIKTAREVNNYKKDWVVEQIQKAANGFIKQNNKAAKIVCFGLSFKPNIDDLRESPALDIYLDLKKLGFDVVAVEPNIAKHEGVKLVDLKTALSTADICVLLVKHKEFLPESFDVKNKKVIDFCGVLNASSRR
jgi:UDP-N-acetyl-D-mannosaminuronic acid dehydrogenase